MYYIYDCVSDIQNNQELTHVIKDDNEQIYFVVKDKEDSELKIEKEWNYIYERYLVSAPLKYNYNYNDEIYKIVKAFSLYDLIEKVKKLIFEKNYRLLSNYKIIKQGQIEIYIVEIGLINEDFLNLI